MTAVANRPILEAALGCDAFVALVVWQETLRNGAGARGNDADEALRAFGEYLDGGDPLRSLRR
jgi:hypothetical protein